MTKYVAEASDLKFVPGQWPLWVDYCGLSYIRDDQPQMLDGEMIGYMYRNDEHTLLVFND